MKYPKRLLGAKRPLRFLLTGPTLTTTFATISYIFNEIWAASKIFSLHLKKDCVGAGFNRHPPNQLLNYSTICLTTL